jgi:hypothetical protein
MSYATLVRTLDGLRQEAPKDFKRYHPKPTENEKINQARSMAYIHLFLKVRFGLLKFMDRHALICDGAQDGGVDGYHIDNENRLITLIQAKFRTTEKNFEEKSIDVSELLKMEVGRISKGEMQDSNAVEFSPRIAEFQKKISEIRDVALYNWRVVILANIHKVNDEQIRRLLDNMQYEIFDYPRTYNELVFPLSTGTNFSPDEITLKINLGKKQQHQLSQEVDTLLGICNVRMLYIPTLEIARCMGKFRNALLKYNPRNYLSLSGNEVNKSIKETIKNTTKNEFSLWNNGITIIADYSSVTDRTGVNGQGQLIVKNPQILNGGQTATTLAMMLDDGDIGVSAFEGKEVLLKIIERPEGKTEAELAEFIESISDATNKQSKIFEADRRSNDPRLVALQNHFFQLFGLFLERKRGEFKYGLDEKIISKADIVDRVSMARALSAYAGQPERARSSQERIFEEEGFDRLLNKFNAQTVAFAYFALQALEKDQTEAQIKLPPHSMRYGKYAMLFAVAQTAPKLGSPIDAPVEAKSASTKVLENWLKFEKFATTRTANQKFLSDKDFNFDGYYKGATVADDITQFTWSA